MNTDNNQKRSSDIHLDVPSEANREKHINFREREDNDNRQEESIDDFAKERKREWDRGIAEGKEAQKEQD